MEALCPTALFDLDHTIAAPLFAGCRRPWEILPALREYLLALGARLDPAEFEEREPHVWIARDAVVAPTASLTGPCIVDREAEVRHCAFVRGSALIGKGAVVGNSTELKNALLFDRVQVPHYNYVGDSILGYLAHLGAGAVTSNVKSDRTPVTIRVGQTAVETGLKKLGALVGDGAEIGCGAVLNPGTVVGRGSTVYPLSMVRGFVPEHSIYKKRGEVVEKR